MGRVSVASLALVVAASLVTGAWAAAPGESSRQTAVQTQGVNLAGRVSMDGKILLADDENSWSVSNTGALKGFEGRYVVVKCRMDPAKVAIRILYVVEPGALHAANLRDSAFRR